MDLLHAYGRWVYNRLGLSQVVLEILIHRRPLNVECPLRMLRIPSKLNQRTVITVCVDVCGIIALAKPCNTGDPQQPSRTL